MKIGFQHWNSCPRSKWNQRQTGSVLLAQSPLLISPLRAHVLTVQLEWPGPWTLGSPVVLWQAAAPWRLSISPLGQGGMEGRGLLLALNQVDLFPVVAIANYYKCSGLKLHVFILVQFWGLQKSELGYTRLKSRCRWGWFLLGAPVENLFLSPFSF